MRFAAVFVRLHSFAWRSMQTSLATLVKVSECPTPKELRDLSIALGDD